MISVDTISRLSAVVVSSDEHNLRDYLFSRYIEVFDSRRLAEALCDGKNLEPDEEINTSCCSKDGVAYFCRFTSRGDYLHVCIRIYDAAIMEILISENRITFMPKADKMYSHLCCQIVNSVLSGINFQHTEAYI